MNKIIVYIPGCWDLLHVGHLNILQWAKALGDILIVGVESDELIEKEKGCAPIIKCAERVRMLEALKCVDAAVPFYAFAYDQIVGDLAASVFIIGTHHKGERFDKVEEFLRPRGGKVIRFPSKTENVSDTIIKERIRNAQ